MKAKAKGVAVSPLIDNIEVCKRLGVKPDCFRKRVQKGVCPLPFTCAGSRGYYRLFDVRHYQKTGQWPDSVKFRDQRQTLPSPLSAELPGDERTPVESEPESHDPDTD